MSQLQADDAVIKSEAESLCQTLRKCEFLIPVVFQCDGIYEVNFVSKNRQGEIAYQSTEIESFKTSLVGPKMFELHGLGRIHGTVKEIAEYVEVIVTFPATTEEKEKIA